MEHGDVSKSCAPQRKQFCSDGNNPTKIFEEINVVIMWDGKPSSLDKRRITLFNSRFHEEGGWRGTNMSKETTHLIANKWTAVLKHHWDCSKCPSSVSSQFKMVSYEWLDACSMVGEKVPEHFFRIDLEGDTATQMKRFKEECGVIGEEGKWKYVPWKGWDVLEDMEEVVEASKVKMKAPKTFKATFKVPPCF